MQRCYLQCGRVTLPWLLLSAKLKLLASAVPALLLAQKTAASVAAADPRGAAAAPQPPTPLPATRCSFSSPLLSPLQVPTGPRTVAALRNNINVSIQYLEVGG